MKQLLILLACPALYAGDYIIRNDTKGGESLGGTIKVTLLGTKNEKKEFTIKVDSKETLEEGLALCLSSIEVEGIDGVVKGLKTTQPVDAAQGCFSFKIFIKHSGYDEKEKKPGTLTVQLSST